MPKVFGKKQARREDFSRQQHHALGLRVGTIALPAHHGPRRRARVGSGLRRVLPGGNDQKPHQVPAASLRALAGFAGAHRVGSERSHHETTSAPDGLQRQTRADFRARGQVRDASDFGHRRFWYRYGDRSLRHACQHTKGFPGSRRLGVNPEMDF